MTFATQLAEAFTPIGAVYDAPSTTQALSWAQTFVEEYCNVGENGFDLVTGDIALVDPKPSSAAGGRFHKALLPHYPVANVSLVEAYLPASTGGMSWVTLTNYAWTADTGLIYDTSCLPGMVTSVSYGPTWPWLPASLRVTYDHGYASVPSGLINAACRFAQQYLENPTLLLQRSVGSEFNQRYAGNTGGVGIVINQFDERIMDRYVRISIA